MFNMLELYYFSPTGGTKRVGELFCKGIAENIDAIDLGKRNATLKQPSGDIIVVAMPVFGGRIPQIAVERLEKLVGAGKKVITLVVYGNRAYEDALLELNHVMEEKEFQIIASGAFVAQHSIVPEVGKGRPDEQDQKSISEFSQKVLDKIKNGIETPVKVPGNYPYKNGMNMPVTPISLPLCKHCGKCMAVCSTGAIQIEEDAIITDSEKCILCMSCSSVCTDNARILPPPLQEQMNQKLGAFKSVRNENEYFL